MPTHAPYRARAVLRNLRRIFGIDGPALRVLRADLAALHLSTQMLRFARLFVIYFTAHAVFPNGWNWQVLGLLIATSAEWAFQQMFPQLPLARVLQAIIASPALCRHLGALHATGASGAPATVPIVASQPATPASATVYTPVTAPDPNPDQSDEPPVQ